MRAALVALAERIGASPVDLPDLAALHAAHRAILRFEAYRTHRELLRSDAARYGPRLRSALEEGAAVNEVAYRDALDMRSRAAADLTRILRDVDAVLLPVVPCVAPPLDPATGRAATAHELTRWTFLANLTGLPAVAFPVGAHAGLPLSLQLIGRPGEELSLLEAARAWTASA